MKLSLPVVFMLVCLLPLIESCTPSEKSKNSDQANEAIEVYAEQFADFRILRYEVPGWDQLTLQQKKLAYYLYEATLCGRDIFYDQGYKNNLIVRRTLEAILGSGAADTSSTEYKHLLVYTKRVWFSSGVHHVYSNNKVLPGFQREWFAEHIRKCDTASLPLMNGQNVEQFISFITPILFDPNLDPKRVNLDQGIDHIMKSAVNFYENVTETEVTDYYKKLIASDSKPSWGLNSKLIKENGELIEKTWKAGGMYDAAITKIIYWLTKAKEYAENENQQKVITLLIEYYQTGNLKKFDDYSIAWVKDTSTVDFVNGFIEVYRDPIAIRGSFEAYVSIKDFEASKRIKSIGDQAQWFEDHSPIMDEHKKKEVKGISAKVINVVVESGDLAPLTAIGINLPNAEWIRESPKYGSKSVTIGNITHAYSEDGKTSGVVQEFYFGDTVKNRLKEFGSLTGNLHTDMHEVIGHASGQTEEGVGTFGETLKNYSSTLEEARADLVALYYITDPKLVEIGVMPNAEAGRAEFDKYITNGLFFQLVRLPEEDTQLEESHMRNRQMIAAWVYEKGMSDQVIEKVQDNGKTYFVVRDYLKLRDLFGQLLREVQRIKSQGDYAAGSALVENYGVKVDAALHLEALERFRKLNIAPYKGFIQPRLVPVMNGEEITDVKIEYPSGFMEQMLEYAKHYSYLPDMN